MMGYHVKDIARGEYGEASKIFEEWDEFCDARLQQNAVLELCELADLIGAIGGYVEKTYNISLKDVIDFAEMTREAFKKGERQ